MQRLTLVGYRGCGKTTIGRLVATALDWRFIDLDRQITVANGRSIAAIFADDGEAAFRTFERSALRAALVGTRKLVLSTGGGCVLSPANRAILRSRGGLVVYLKVPVAELQRRLRCDAVARPSLTGRHPADEAAEVLAVRDPLYRTVAHAIIDANRAPGAIVRQLVQRVENLAKPSRKPGVA